MFTGEAIRMKRKALGLSATELAEQLGISTDNLYKWEKGHTPTNPEDFLKVESWLNSNGMVSKNTPDRPQEAQHGQDYKDRYLQLLEELHQLRRQEQDGNSNLVKQLLDDLRRNQALLNAIIDTLPEIIQNTGKKKIREAVADMGKRITHHLDVLKKAGT